MLVTPASVKKIGPYAFAKCEYLKSVQLNEGLEKLGEKEIIFGIRYTGTVFASSAIENIIFPSTLRRIEAETFRLCKNLKSVDIPNGVEYIGEGCFQKSGIKEIALSNTLKEISEDAFKECENLKTVWVEEGCTINIRKCVKESTDILPTQAMANRQSLRNLRRLREVTIPEGIEKIGEKWFKDTEVVKMTISASVMVIENMALYNCKSLREVVFEEGSKLMKIGRNVF